MIANNDGTRNGCRFITAPFYSLGGIPFWKKQGRSLTGLSEKWIL